MNKNPIFFNLDPIELAELHTYERHAEREFHKEPSTNSSGNSKKKLRPLRISKWCRRIFNQKQK